MHGMSSVPRRAAILLHTPLAMKVALEVMAELEKDRETRRRAPKHGATSPRPPSSAPPPPKPAR
jgi:hypothetical protein